MAHYAFLDDNNVVTEVIVGRNEDDLPESVTSWEEYYGNLRNQTCLRTSYNTYGGFHSKGGSPFRFNYAGIGYTFDPEIGESGAFIPPKPFPSWVLNTDTCLWDAPVPHPDQGLYTWNETSVEWEEVILNPSAD